MFLHLTSNSSAVIQVVGHWTAEEHIEGLQTLRQTWNHTDTSLLDRHHRLLNFLTYELNPEPLRPALFKHRLASIDAVDTVPVSHTTGRLHGDGHLLHASHSSLQSLH